MEATKTEPSAFNGQLNNEFQAAYLYLAMSAYCEAENLPGFASWLRQQSKEEVSHGMQFYQFILDRGERVELQTIDAPQNAFSSVLEVFEMALANEKEVTKSIYDLYRLAESRGDYAAHSLLEAFAAEQVEEEKNVGYIVESLKRIGGDGTGLFMLDMELGKRSLSETEPGSGGA